MVRVLASFVAAVSVVAFHVSSSGAYEIRTHGQLTHRSFAESPAVQGYLNAIGTKVTDVLDAPARTSPLGLSGFENNGTVLGWLIEGSMREDDYHLDLSLLGCEPPRNPPSAIDRIRHHFFDPENGRGLHLGPISLGLPAPAWALGEQGRGFAPDQNQFSLLDARLYQLRSLIESTPEERERYTALFFRSLGHVLHLLQDMAQPQHTRNDAHPACDNALSERVLPEHSWYEEYIEHRALGEQFRGRPVHPLMTEGYPAPSFPTYFSYFSHDDRQRGLADFSSRNFFSAATNLGAWPPCGGRGEPPCDPGAYTAVDVPHAVTTARGDRIEAPVRLLRRTMQDPNTLAPIPDVAVTSRSVWDQHLETRGQSPVYAMNVLNFDAISDVLLPRAVGYGAAFLEHFFAGQLDASVQPAGDPDPAVLKLVARNASQEAVDGVLLVYAEDTLTRRRQSVLTATDAPQPLGAVPTGVVLAGGLFPEVPFRPPFSAEKYVVVYHGKRLGPRTEDPPAGAIGSVMAQVLGGPRVEAIVSVDDRRLLRAVAGTFDLPPAAAGLALMQWSDVDNHFVGITGAPLVTGQPAPDEIKLFRIERPIGSVEVPLATGADPPTVDATLVRTVAFPYGLTLPTRVEYVQHVHVRQPLLTYERTLALTWDEGAGAYQQTAHTVGPPALEIPVDETVTFEEQFPVVLDRAHLAASTAATPRPYLWRVLEVGQDARERLLAVVEVQFTRPVDADRRVVLTMRNQDCSAFEPRGAHDVAGVFHAGGLIALIDVESGTLVGSTGTSLFAPSSTELAQISPFVQERRVTIRTGGPQPGTEIRCVDPVVEEFLPTEMAGAVILPPVGMTEFTVPGLYRPDVEAVAGTPVSIVTGSGEFELIYATVDGVNKVVTLTAPSSRVEGHLTSIREGARMRPGSRLSTEVLLRFDRPKGIGEIGAVLVRWDPESSLGTRLAVPGPLDPGRYRLAYVTSDAALLRVEDPFGGDVRTLLAELDTASLRSFAGDITSQYVLLPPAGLYGLVTTRFHTLDTLAETALPPALAPGPVAIPAASAYHVIVRD